MPVPDTVATIACDDCAGSRVIVTEVDDHRVELDKVRRYFFGHGRAPAPTIRVTILAGCARCEGSCLLMSA